MSDDSEPKKIVHRVEVDRTPEIDSLHSENAELKSKLELAALAEVERLKEDLAKQYPQAKSLVSSCGTPQQIEDLKSNLKDSYGTGKRTPSGKASLTRQSSGEEFEDQRALVDEMYSKAYDKTRTDVTEAERKEAKNNVEKMVESMITGKSWSQLQRQQIPLNTNLIACPKCGKSIDVVKDIALDSNNKESGCRYCGYKLKKGDY
jgi:tRNA G10  N-methylase Trm11